MRPRSGDVAFTVAVFVAVAVAIGFWVWTGYTLHADCTETGLRTTRGERIWACGEKDSGTE